MPKLKTYGRCFVAAAALLLPGACGEHKDDEWIPLQTPVQIATRVQEPETKAPVDAFANGDQIGVFGFYHDNSTWSTDPDNKPDYMYNQLMTYNATTLAWEYSPVKYWPNETGPSLSTGTDLLSFWGYHPHNGSLPDGVTLNPVKSNGDSYTSASTGLPDIAFTQSTTAGDSQVDLMVSDLVKDQTQTYEINSGVVVLPFSHALSKVDVNVKKKDPTLKYTVTLKNVSFNGIYHTGIIRWDALLETWDWANWSGPRQKLSVWEDDPDDDSDDIVLTSKENHALPAVLPLPQSLADASARLHVEFSVSYEGILHERSTTSEVLLSQVFEEAGAAWHKNSHYTLNITISPDDPIEFTVSWSDWGDAYNYHITD